jgi:hypothetical protein
MLFVSIPARNFIRTVPVLQHDLKRAEDGYGLEDHAADACRYAVMSRRVPVKDEPKRRGDGTGY